MEKLIGCPVFLSDRFIRLATIFLAIWNRIVYNNSDYMVLNKLKGNMVQVHNSPRYCKWDES